MWTKTAFATVIGPLLEALVLISLVNVAFKFRDKYIQAASTGLRTVAASER